MSTVLKINVYCFGWQPAGAGVGIHEHYLRWTHRDMVPVPKKYGGQDPWPDPDIAEWWEPIQPSRGECPLVKVRFLYFHLLLFYLICKIHEVYVPTHRVIRLAEGEVYMQMI